MIAEKTVTILGKEVHVRYCTATETGFEIMSGKKMDVFTPVTRTNDSGRLEIVEPARATTIDYLYLALSAVLAAYEREGLEAPITDNELLYDASPSEVETLLTAVMTLRSEWYGIPKVVEEIIESDKKGRKAEEAAEDSEKN